MKFKRQMHSRHLLSRFFAFAFVAILAVATARTAIPAIASQDWSADMARFAADDEASPAGSAEGSMRTSFAGRLRAVPREFIDPNVVAAHH